MKKKDLREFATKSIEDIKKKISELEKQKIETRIQIKMGKLKNVHHEKQIRKAIAYLKTHLKLKLFAQEVEKDKESASKHDKNNQEGEKR